MRDIGDETGEEWPWIAWLDCPIMYNTDNAEKSVSAEAMEEWLETFVQNNKQNPLTMKDVMVAPLFGAELMVWIDNTIGECPQQRMLESVSLTRNPRPAGLLGVRNELGRWSGIGWNKKMEKDGKFYQNHPALRKSWCRKFVSIAVDCGCMPDSPQAQALMKGMTADEREHDIVRRCRNGEGELESVQGEAGEGGAPGAHALAD